MKQHWLGIIGGVLLIGGIALGVATGIAASRSGVGVPAAMRAPIVRGGAPIHTGPRQSGPGFGIPGRPNFPQPGPVYPRPNNPGPSPSG